MKTVISTGMSDLEFADYHLRYSTDPVVVKLCEIILDDSKIEDLTEEVAQLKDELGYTKRQLKETQYEVQRLEERTIVDFAESLQNEVNRANQAARNARAEKLATDKLNQELQEKINVWKIMET